MFLKYRKILLGSPLARHTAAYGGVNAITNAIPYLIGPILTYYLTPKDYGIVTLFAAASAFLGPLGGFGVQSAFRRRFYQAEYDYPSYLLSASIVVFAQLAVIVALGAVTYRWWATPEVGYLWPLVLFPWTAGRYVAGVASALLQLNKRPLAYGILSWVASLLNLGLSLLLVVGLGYGWQGRILGQTLAAGISALIALCILRSLLGRWGHWRRAYAKDATEFGLPTVPYALLDRVMRFGDRTLIAGMVSLDQAGLYGLSAQISGLVSQVSMSLSQAWQPWLFEQLETGAEAAKRRVVLALYAASAGLLLCGFGLWLAMVWLLPFVIEAKFTPALVFAPWLCIGFALRGIAQLLAQVVVFSGKTGELSKIAVKVALLSLTLQVTLIALAGASGAAIGTCLAYAANLLLVWRAARRVVPLPGL